MLQYRFRPRVPHGRQDNFLAFSRGGSSVVGRQEMSRLWLFMDIFQLRLVNHTGIETSDCLADVVEHVYRDASD